MVAQARVEGMGFDCTLSMDLDSDENTPPSNAHSSAFSSSSSSSPSNSSTPGTNTSGSSSSSSSSSHSSKVVQPRPKGKFSPKGPPRGSHFVGNTSAKHALAPSNGARAFGKSWIAAPPHARLDQAKMIAAAKALDDDKAEAERKIKDVIEQNRCDRLELDARKVSLEEQEKAIDAMLVKQKAAEQTYEINKAALAVRQTEFDLQHKRLRSTIKSTTASDKTRKDDLDARERKIKAGEKALERTLTSTKAFQQKEGEDFDEAAGCLAGDLKLAHKENEMLRSQLRENKENQGRTLKIINKSKRHAIKQGKAGGKKIAHISGKLQATNAKLRKSAKREKTAKKSAKKARSEMKKVKKEYSSVVKKLQAMELTHTMDLEGAQATLRELEQLLEESGKKPAATTMAKGRYTNELRVHLYTCLERGVALNTLPVVIRAMFDFAGMPDARIPSSRTLGRMLVEMGILSKAHAAQVWADTDNCALAHDGAGRNNLDLVNVNLQTPGGRIFVLGLRIADGKKSQQTLDTMVAMEQELKELAEKVHGTTTADRVSLNKIADGFNGSGAMTDHASNERKTYDLLEALIHDRMMKGTGPAHDAYRAMSKDEQDEFCMVGSQYCYQHKVENMSVAAFEGLTLWQKEGTTPGEEAPEPVPDGDRAPTAVNAMYQIHKLLGCPTEQSGNKYSQHQLFEAYLRNIIQDEASSDEQVKGAELAMAAHRRLGCFNKGARFFKNHQNADCHAYLLPYIKGFLQDNKESSSSFNLLKAAVLELCSSERVLVGLTVASLQYHSFFRPSKELVPLVKNQRHVARVVTEWNDFCESFLHAGDLLDDGDTRGPAYGAERVRDRIMLRQPGTSLNPHTFISDRMFKEICPLDDGGVARQLYDASLKRLQVCGADSKFFGAVHAGLTIGFAQMRKKNLNMSGFLVVHGYQTPAFSRLPSVATWMDKAPERAEQGDNCASETFFAKWGNLGRHNQNMSNLHREGIIMYKQNRTDEWIKRKIEGDEAEQAKFEALMKHCASSKAVREQEIAEKDDRHRRWTMVQQTLLDDKKAVEAKKLATKQTLDKIFDSSIVWTAETLEDEMNKLKSASDKTKAITNQFAIYKAWAQSLGLAWVSQTPSDGKVESWKQALVKFLRPPHPPLMMPFPLRAPEIVAAACKRRDSCQEGKHPALSSLQPHHHTPPAPPPLPNPLPSPGLRAPFHVFIDAAS